MKTKIFSALMLTAALLLTGATLTMAQPASTKSSAAPSRPQGPCDVYAAAGDPCVGAYSTTRAMYASYDGPLYQVTRQSDGRTLNIGIVEPSASNAGGYADAAAQDKFCANTYCWITEIYDQSPKHNNLTQAPRGGWTGPAMGGMDNLPIADMAPVMVMGHKVYGVFIEPGMGLRDDHPAGTAVDDQAEGMYWVINGKHFNAGCCFDFGNAEIDSRDDDAGTMETANFSDTPAWYHGKMPGPWIMTDQENNLVGCVLPRGSQYTRMKLCPKLPLINWRFVTAIAQGEPHHWMSMGGNAQQGRLSIMFSGPRVNWEYDPMRKQGAILLGNGGDNSNSSQGTFYEGAMTAANTYPSNAANQQLQANIVAADYRALPVSMAPASAVANPPGLQTFSPDSSQNTTVTFTNTTGSPVENVKLSISLPNSQWTSAVNDGAGNSASFAGPIAEGASVSATFKITSGPAAFNGDLTGNAWWTAQKSGRKHHVTIAEKVRNVRPIRINEFRIGTSDPGNPTNSFVELYNAGSRSVNISNWTLTVHPAQQAIFSRVKIPAGTNLSSHGFYLLGLSNSGLAAPAEANSSTIFVSSTTGMKAGDTIQIGAGSHAETRTIQSVGTAAANHTTLWQPLPNGPIMTIPPGSTNVPVTSVSGFAVGQKIALGYGATYPTVPARREHYEVATVTNVGKPGTQAYLAADATAGATNIKVTSVKNISVGDKIRLDIDSVGHGIETITVTKVGTQAHKTRIVADAAKGATNVKVYSSTGFAVGDKMTIGTPADWETVTITSVGTPGATGSGVDFTPALHHTYPAWDFVVDQGTGLELAAPLRFNHAANLPFSDRGTGISFEPATAFAHISDEPVQALGTGITLNQPLAANYPVNTVVRDAGVKDAGYQGTPAPNQWFGGPAFTTNFLSFGRMVTVSHGSMVLRDANGLVVDSLNYGGLVDPWAAEGYQGKSGLDQEGCFVATPASAGGSGVSAGRAPDGYDTDSNCADFVTSPVTTMAAASTSGSTNIKVADVDGFSAGQPIRIGTGTSHENATIAQVGTAGATTVRTTVAAGATTIPVTDARSFRRGQTITIGSGTNQETAVVASISWHRGATIKVTEPLTHAHAAAEEVAGSGITLTAPLTNGYAVGTQVAGSAPTPGAPNHYYRKPE